jgi:hypothetical protein
MDFDGLASIDFDEKGHVVNSTMDVDVERKRRRILVTLPFS